MVFSSLLFIFAFLPCCLLLYFISPNLKLKNSVLLIASLLFYAFGEPVYILVLCAAALSAFLFAKKIDKQSDLRRRKILLALSVTINVSFLFFFKYVPFIIDTVNIIFRTALPIPKVIMPIGISFYTFQILTYTIDIYFGKTPVQCSFKNFLLYVSLFPQLIAGPIVRYADVESQLSARAVTLEKFAGGVRLFVCGLAKKVLIADYAGKLAVIFLETGNFSTAGVWFGILMFTFQIYFDFSGYSDMALGLGLMFGFDFLPNFNYPYISRSVTEFWRRWHMSLSMFFRDYVYIPLGGNRRFQLRNIAVVWLLTGLWHGASWNFVLWGAYFGAILIIEKYAFARMDFSVPHIVKWLYTFAVAVFGWVIFYFTDIARIGAAFNAMFIRHTANFQTVYDIKQNIIFLIFCFVSATPLMSKLYRRVRGVLPVAADAALSSVYVLTLLSASCASLVGSSFSPFLYFRF